MQKLGFCQRLGLGWTVVAKDGLVVGQVIGISRQGITVSNDGLIETFTQSEAQKMLFVKEG